MYLKSRIHSHKIRVMSAASFHVYVLGYLHAWPPSKSPLTVLIHNDLIFNQSVNWELDSRKSTRGELSNNNGYCLEVLPILVLTPLWKLFFATITVLFFCCCRLCKGFRSFPKVSFFISVSFYRSDIVCKLDGLIPMPMQSYCTTIIARKSLYIVRINLMSVQLITSPYKLQWTSLYLNRQCQ